jgi:tRNA(fMet)-specific endonuclease VapC
MGVIIDSAVFVKAERENRDNPLEGLPTDEAIAISAITASEIMEGMSHAVSGERRQRREMFVDHILGHFDVVPFTLAIAKIHARLRADLRRRGTMTGAHDLIIAATAVSLGWDVLTANGKEFRQVERLKVREM